MEQQSLLQELEQEVILQPAEKGTRFVNYLIDLVVFYVFMFVVGLIWGVIYISDGNSLDNFGEDQTLNGKLLEYLISYTLYLIFYTLFEGATKGRTIGKYITKTVAVKSDGSPITWNEAFKRSLCRIIPFEPFSGLGNSPWHDSITNTIVVKKD